MLDAMFNSILATQEDEITLPDVEPAAFLALYSDEVSERIPSTLPDSLPSIQVQIGPEPETVMTALYTVKKYAVPALEKHCADFL